MILNAEYFKQFSGYTEFETPIVCKDFNVLGYFYYHTASVYSNSKEYEIPCLPRSMFVELEQKINEKGNLTDNKTVFICKQTANFGHSNFAINFKDFIVRIGNWDNVASYGAGPLRKIENE